MDSRIYILTHKRLTGQLTQVEQQEFASLSRIPDNKAVSEEIEYLWNVSKSYFPVKDWKKDDAKQAFLQKIKSTPRKVKPVAASAPTYNWAKIGLAVVAALVLGWLLIKAFTPKAEVIEAAESIEYAEIFDGTKVWLDHGAQLKILDESDNKRMVALDGEAMFDVVHNPESPFIVDLGKGLNLEVLGTSFRAKSAHDGQTSIVSVREGKVRMYSNKDKSYELILSAGEQGEMNPSEGINIKKDASVYTAISQSLDPLTFDEEPLTRVLEKLGLFYGVEFEYNEEGLKECQISTVVHPNTELDETIQVIMDIHPNVRITPQLRNSYKVTGSCK